MHSTIEQVTQRIVERSKITRTKYLDRIDQAADQGPSRSSLSCSNLAHGIAACSASDKEDLIAEDAPNIAIVSAYNDMLSAHQPYARYPEIIKQAAKGVGAQAQFAGGVPAMCDGVTQGRDGMDLSLFSRDAIALSTAIALSHDMFDATLCLGICDKIVPGLLIGALNFGHLPTVFVPAGPMPSGLSNKEKAEVREAFAAGAVGRSELIAAESAAYHSPGTCTFYGTANSNQMLMEFMGLQLPNSSFVAPEAPIRDELTKYATRQVIELTKLAGNYTPVGHIVSEAAIVNGIIGLLSTGGSTNHTIHLIAIAAAAGIQINWQDFSDLGEVIPLLAQVYPNGSADVNQFHAAGGLSFLIKSLHSEGLLNDAVNTIMGPGLEAYTKAPVQETGNISWKPASSQSGDRSVLREASDPFQADGGLKILKGKLGNAVVKVSAVAPEHRKVTAPARIFTSQGGFTQAFENGELSCDMVVVLPFQGPAANGMPELHKLSPYLGTLQNQGFNVALLTDGRMSGASGKVLSAIHVTPEAAQGGLIGRIQDGDQISIDAETGCIEIDADLENRSQLKIDLSGNHVGTGREMFSVFRQNVGSAETGASIFGFN